MKFDKGYFGKTLKEMDDRELCRRYKELDESISSCSGSRDVRAMDVIDQELTRRGIDITVREKTNPKKTKLRYAQEEAQGYYFENGKGEEIET